MHPQSCLPRHSLILRDRNIAESVSSRRFRACEVPVLEFKRSLGGACNRVFEMGGSEVLRSSEMLGKKGFCWKRGGRGGGGSGVNSCFCFIF